MGKPTTTTNCEHVRKSQMYAKAIAEQVARETRRGIEDPMAQSILRGMYRANIADHLAHCVRNAE